MKAKECKFSSSVFFVLNIVFVFVLFSNSSEANYNFLKKGNYFEYLIKISSVEFRISSYVEKDTSIKGNKYFKVVTPNDPGKGLKIEFLSMDTVSNILYKYEPDCKYSDKSGKLAYFYFLPGNSWNICNGNSLIKSSSIKQKLSNSNLHLSEKLNFTYVRDSVLSKDKVIEERCYSEKLGLRSYYCSNKSPFGKFEYIVELVGAVISGVKYGDVLLGNLSLENEKSTNEKIILNYPNPFNPVTIIKLNLNQSQHVNISIYDMLGKLVENLCNNFLVQGSYNFQFSGANLCSGIYFYKLQLNSYSETKRITLIK
jgi:hypothetical protein